MNIGLFMLTDVTGIQGVMHENSCQNKRMKLRMIKDIYVV